MLEPTNYETDYSWVYDKRIDHLCDVATISLSKTIFQPFIAKHFLHNEVPTELTI